MGLVLWLAHCCLQVPVKGSHAYDVNGDLLRYQVHVLHCIRPCCCQGINQALRSCSDVGEAQPAVRHQQPQAQQCSGMRQKGQLVAIDSTRCCVATVM
jgi:hypothetical protein